MSGKSPETDPGHGSRTVGAKEWARLRTLGGIVPFGGADRPARRGLRRQGRGKIPFLPAVVTGLVVAGALVVWAIL